MLKTFARRLSRRLGNVLKFLSPEDLDNNILDQEKNLYKREIVKAAQVIASFDDDNSQVTPLCEAIDRMGCLAYTGGPPANKCAAQFLPQLCELLKRKESKFEVLIATLKCISIICMNHTDHQDQCFSEGLLQSLSELIASSAGGCLYWSIYCLHNVGVGNITNLQVVADDVCLHPFLYNATKLPWLGFSTNYAVVVLRLLGLSKQGQEQRWDSIPEDENDANVANNSGT